MSLDVYLTVKRDEVPEAAQAVALLREHGFGCLADEIEARHDCRDYDEVYSENVTGNLWKMAAEAGICDCLWSPEEHGITKARQLIGPLRSGLALLRADPERFKKHNPTNGWGSYDGFVPWVAAYLAACEDNPDADVRVCG